MKQRSNYLDGWARIERDSEWIPWDGCRIWLGSTDSSGYGQFTPEWGGGECRIHRWVVEEAQGSIPPDAIVMHTCDHPSCINPAHLRVGTQQDNVHDAYSKGRRPIYRGEEHGMAKLNTSNVQDIRRRLIAGGETITHIARQYNVDRTTVSCVRNNKTWRHLAWPTS